MGGFGNETSRFISKLVEKTAEKSGNERSVVGNYIRTNISFELIRSQVACIRGSRALWKRPVIPVDLGEMQVVDSVGSITEC